MTTVAYNEYVAVEAMKTLAVFFDYGINYLGFSLEDICNIWVKSYNSECFEMGDPRVCLGMSGRELFEDCMYTIGKTIPERVDYPFMWHKSPEYWFGWIIAHYQWYSCKSFRYIFEHVDINYLLDMYNPLHCTDEGQIMQFIDELIDTNLKNK